jgi:hypothetical protein
MSIRPTLLFKPRPEKRGIYYILGRESMPLQHIPSARVNATGFLRAFSSKAAIPGLFEASRLPWPPVVQEPMIGYN